MTGPTPQHRVAGTVSAGAVPSLRSWLAALLAGAAGGVALRSVLAQNGAGAPSLPVLVGAAAAVAVLAAVLLSVARVAGTEVRFYRDRLEYEGHGLLGPVRGPTSVAYEDVDLVLRRDTAGDERTGAASYELVRSGTSNVRLRHLSDPETVERLLEGYVPGPRQRVEASDDARAALQRERVFWRGWPDDEPLPQSAVVTSDALAAEIGRELDVEPPEVSSAADSRRSTLTAADFENGNFPGGGSGGDADFTGGSSQYSPGHASNEGGAESNVGSDGATDMGDGGM